MQQKELTIPITEAQFKMALQKYQQLEQAQNETGLIFGTILAQAHEGAGQFKELSKRDGVFSITFLIEDKGDTKDKPALVE